MHAPTLTLRTCTRIARTPSLYPVQVTLTGVDRTQLVQFYFEAGGADGFVEALQLDTSLTLEYAPRAGEGAGDGGDDEAVTALYTVQHASAVATTAPEQQEQAPHPAALCEPPCPRCYLLQAELGAAAGAAGGEFTTLAKRSSPLPRSTLLYQTARAGRFGDGVRRALGFLPRASRLGPDEVGARIEEYLQRRRLRMVRCRRRRRRRRRRIMCRNHLHHRGFLTPIRTHLGGPKGLIGAWCQLS